MSIRTHIRLTLILILLTIVCVVVNRHYRAVNPINEVINGHRWTVKHRGYPSQFGLLNHLLDIRVVDVELDSVIKNNQSINQMHFYITPADGNMAKFSIDYNAIWGVTREGHVKFDVDINSIKVAHVDAQISQYVTQNFATDLVVSMIGDTRKIIAVSQDELIIEIPYLGIVRAVRTQ
ncbi:hypothetical protein [Thaumasiovibrio subtropicus]|uniref:hypothetical protein n=1 Tax=Thaumasiovibrio subtropicus TaxID=1891207 RepID=UPI000B35ABA3|nr:hypothetical protein [Thaumasiovibrio subtropicus]